MNIKLGNKGSDAMISELWQFQNKVNPISGVQLIKALYSMQQATILFWKHFRNVVSISMNKTDVLPIQQAIANNAESCLSWVT